MWGALAGIAGGTITSALSADAADKAVNRQISWERERAQNAHQWEMADLKAAGVNPIMTMGGQGATTGGISAPVPDYSGINSGITNAINALAISKENEKKDAEISNIDANSALQVQQTIKTQQETINEMRREGLIDAQKQREYTENLLKTGQTEIMYIELKKQYATYQTEIAKAKQELAILKQQGQINKAKVKQAEIDEKMAWVDKIFGYIEKGMKAGAQVGAAMAVPGLKL